VFGLGITEILLILVLALLVLGPEKLPETARQLGKITGQLRRAMDDIRHDISFNDARQFDLTRVKRQLVSSQDSCCEDNGEESSKSTEPKKEVSQKEETGVENG
jgi:Tat protein translocase TatB subunit